MRLYPRLPPTVASALVCERAWLPVAQLVELASTSHPAQIYAPLGGNRVTSLHLEELSYDARVVAAGSGYPVPPSREQARRFDSHVAALLHRDMQITPSEASSDGVWQFMACVLLPDLVRWRFYSSTSSTSPERFHGRNRNALGRLWWRACILHDENADNPYHLIEALGEDEIVQLLERPTLAGDRRLTKTIASCFLRQLAANAERAISVPRMSLMRDTQKRILRLYHIVAFGVIDPADVASTVSEAFEIASQALSRGGTGL